MVRVLGIGRLLSSLWFGLMVWRSVAKNRHAMASIAIPTTNRMPPSTKMDPPTTSHDDDDACEEEETGDGLSFLVYAADVAGVVLGGCELEDGEDGLGEDDDIDGIETA